MADPQVVQYVQDSLAQGVPVDEIRNALLSQGWPAEEVEEALSSPGAGYQGGGSFGAQMHPNASFSEVIAGIMRASDKQYSELYLYKIFLQVFVFSVASFLLVFVGLPWFIPLLAVGVLAPVAYMQIGSAKKKSGMQMQQAGF